MTNQLPSIISIGYGRNFFIEGNAETDRMKNCAAATEGLHMIIFTLRSDGFKPLTLNGNLHLHPTNSLWRPLMLIDAWLIARKIIISNKKNFTITTQDPFETGLVGYLLKKIYKLRLVIQEHGDVFSTNFWRDEKLTNRLRYHLGLWLLKKADLVRVVGERTEVYLRAQGIKQIKRLPVAIDTSLITEIKPSEEVAKIFPADTKVYLTVARLVPQKNLELLLKAFHEASLVDSDIRLLIVGSGREESKLKFLSQELFGDNKVVAFLPWSNDVIGLMKASYVYVLSSNYEGWARVLIEAVISKLPVITTNVGCAGEVVKDLEHGIIVPVNNQKALAAAILKFANGDFHQSIRNNLEDLNVDLIPGTNLEVYGESWVKTLQ